MNHKKCQHKLTRFIEDDLNGKELEEVEQHLRSCKECSRELEKLHTILAAASSARARVVVDNRLLEEARAQFRVALRDERNRRRWWEPLLERFDALVAPPARLAFGVVAMLGCGFLCGYLVFADREVKPPVGVGGPMPERTRITNVRFIGPENVSGQVDFTFDALTPVHMHGSVDDPGIQRVLTYALLNEDNPGVRLRAVSAVSQPGPKPADREVKTALVIALRTDKNPGVRRQALSALCRYPFDDQIKDAMLQTLMSDKNPGLRIAAINALDSLMTGGSGLDQSFIATLRAHSLQDNNNYVRLKSKALLQEVRQQ